MTATLPSTACFTLPPSQNSAPVLEFKCLYTHDLRRKQKRFQDGFLSYHTFNKRVMVYDDMRHFIGDTHWKQDKALQDGDEIHLDKGVIVQVEEALGTTQTDLTALLQRSRPDSAPQDQQRPHAAARLTQLARNSAIQGPSQSRHKSLTALLGTPKGSLGRAMLPTKSPYEARHVDQENEWPVEREAKRIRLDSPAQKHRPSIPRLLQNAGSTNTLSSATAVRSRIASTDRPALQSLSRLPWDQPAASHLIDLTQEDIQDIHSDITLPPDTPARMQQTSRPKPKATKSVLPARTPSPPVSVANRFSAAELGVAITADPGSYNSDGRSLSDVGNQQLPTKAATEHSVLYQEEFDHNGMGAHPEQTLTTQKKTATLRIASRKSKSTLLCQAPTSQMAVIGRQQSRETVSSRTRAPQDVVPVEPAVASIKARSTTSTKTALPTSMTIDSESDDEWAFQTQSTPEKLKKKTAKPSKQRQTKAQAVKETDGNISKVSKPLRKRKDADVPKGSTDHLATDKTQRDNNAKTEAMPLLIRDDTFTAPSPPHADQANDKIEPTLGKTAIAAPSSKRRQAHKHVAILHQDDDFPTSSLLDAIAVNNKVTSAQSPISQSPVGSADPEQTKDRDASAQGQNFYQKPVPQFSKRAQKNIEMRSRSASLEAPTPSPAKPQGIFEKIKGHSTVSSEHTIGAGKDAPKNKVNDVAKIAKKPTCKETRKVIDTATKPLKTTKTKSTAKAQRQEEPALGASKDENLGPWSVEAFDLFDYYRPPDSNVDAKWFGTPAAV